MNEAEFELWKETLWLLIRSREAQIELAIEGANKVLAAYRARRPASK